MLTFAEFAVRAAEWLAPPRPETSRGHASAPRPRLVLSFEPDGGLKLESRGLAPSPAEPDDLRAAASRWDLSASPEGAILVVEADPSRVSGRPDEPDTLFALHALAARRRDARIILKLPPDKFGRRW